MRTICAQPISAKKFAQYGELLHVPELGARAFFEDSLENGRAAAWPSLSIAHVTASQAGPIQVRQMERHRFSSQTFLPLSAATWLVVVAPGDSKTDAPDMARAEAFVLRGAQGITYRQNVWHHPLTVLREPAAFAVFMWRDGTSGDEEFVDVPPFNVTIDIREQTE